MIRQKAIRILAISIVATSSVFKKLRPRLWRWWYNSLAKRDSEGELLFMNYGYHDLTTKPMILSETDEPYRFSIQLYQRVISELDITNKDILEVGCGRGGGLNYIADYHAADHLFGVDLSVTAIEWCRAHHRSPRGLFMAASADGLPLDNESIDVVINVESSHCYSSMRAFLHEVKRVLKPGGYFSLCDFRNTKGLVELDQDLSESGLIKISGSDITSSVVAALDQVSDERQNKISKLVPLSFQKLFGDFAALKNSKIHTMLKQGEMTYVSRLYQKLK